MKTFFQGTGSKGLAPVFLDTLLKGKAFTGQNTGTGLRTWNIFWNFFWAG
jgi:hypothetical protein